MDGGTVWSACFAGVSGNATGCERDRSWVGCPATALVAARRARDRVLGRATSLPAGAGGASVHIVSAKLTSPSPRSTFFSSLPRGVAGQLVVRELDVGRHLERGPAPRPPTACTSSSVSVEPSARPATTALTSSPSSGWGTPMTAASAIVGVLDQAVLDLDAVDVLAAPDDHVLGPVGDEQEAVVVEVADVAGVQPAVDDRLGGGLGLVPVARHDDRALDADLAGLAPAAAASPSGSTMARSTDGHRRADRVRLGQGVRAA